MGRLQAIENALASINPATFQELCDSFLAIRNKNYSAFSRSGSQTGKQKTIKGTPDSFLLLPNGKYIFVEYSTNISSKVSKLKNDLKKCLDDSKTGIPQSQISEIIICTNFNLTIEEFQSLKALVTETRIELTIYTLDLLSIELHLNHRDLTHLYLKFPLDTGQIVSLNRFISEYDNASRGIAAPLSNTFLHRERELDLLKQLLVENDFIVVTGPPGIGKTKLAIECIKHYLIENPTFSAYCISYKQHALLEDLYQYIKSDSDYILFVDDANRIDAFNQITGFYKNSRTGKLKIIITVRDYAFQDIGVLLHQFSFRRVDLNKLTDDQITDIIKAEPFEILNGDFQRPIIRIAEGNPRIAIMTAQLAKATQHVYALANVSELFEKYFSTFIIDDGQFANEFNIKCLGIISFFYTIPYKNKIVTTDILKEFDIDYNEFIEAIDKLDKLELVEIQFEHVKIPEQNLSAFFFYKTFVKEKLLSIDILLEKFFENNVSQFKDCIIPVYNSFGPENVVELLRPPLRKYWLNIKADETKALSFIETFWLFIESETLEYLYSKISTIQEPLAADYQTKRDLNQLNRERDPILDILSNYFWTASDLKDALEMSFKYARLVPERLPNLLHKIEELLTFDHRDSPMFIRQTILFEIIFDGLKRKEKYFFCIFFELSTTFLSFKFRQTRSERRMTITFYEYQIPNNPNIQRFRKNIWEHLDAAFDFDRENAFKLLQTYATVHPNVDRSIMTFDIPFVLSIINKHLNSNSFEECLYVNDQIKWCKQNSVNHPDFDKLALLFTNNLYETFLKVDWDRLRDKEIFEFDDYKEYERLKEAEIRESFLFKSELEVKTFYHNFSYLFKADSNPWSFGRTLDIILDENFERDFTLGLLLLEQVILSKNDINFIPRISFHKHLTSAKHSSSIWNLIDKHSYSQKEMWELSFLDNLQDFLVNKDYGRQVLKVIESINESNFVHLERFEKYLSVFPELYNEALKVIYDRNKLGKFRLQIWMDFLDTFFDKLAGDLSLIKKTYIQQESIQSTFDYDGHGLVKILKKDPTFLIDYILSLYPESDLSDAKANKSLSVIWEINEIEIQLVKVFDHSSTRGHFFGILDHFCNTFFKNIKEEHKNRAKDFLFDYSKINFREYKKMNIVVDICRHAMRDLYEPLLLLFLTMTQDVNIFSKILWRGSGVSGSGDVILADIEAADWRNILSIVQKSEIGMDLLPIKRYLNDKIEACLEQGDHERQMRFLQRF